jgi:tetratricopeptide (TPR) repeat protein/ribosomal protein L37AE/L43A
MMTKNDAASFNDIFHRISLNQSVVLGENVPKDKAEKLLEKLTAIGLKCRIDPMALSLVPVEEDEQQNNVYRCPACGHNQAPAKGGNLDICERCGVVGRNYEAANELKQALEMERRRLREDLEKEKKEKLEEIQDKLNKQREKDRQELLDRARRQAERELGIQPWHKFKVLFKPGVLYPMLGSLLVAFIGVGLLIWQLGGSTDEDVVANNAKTAGLQLTVTPPPGTALKVEGANPQVAQNGASVLVPGGAPATAVPPTVDSDAKVSDTAIDTPAIAATTDKTGVASTTAANATNKSGVATATPKTASPTGSATAVATSPSDAKAPAQPVLLLNVDQLALAPPADKSAAGKTVYRPANDPWLLIRLARYQIQTGDLAAATRSIDRASELLSRERDSLSNRRLDAFNRMQAEVRAEIANRYHQQRELVTAQTQWLRATNLVNSITAPDERAQALSGLARTMNDVLASTAEGYFSRSIAAIPLITEPFSQALALGAIARDLAQAGRPDQSKALFDEAAAAVKKIQNPEAQLVARMILAKHHAEASDTVVAKALLTQALPEKGGKAPPELNQHQAEVLSALALSLANRGERAMARTDFAAAFQQAQMLKDQSRWAEALLYLARDIAAAGDPEASAKLAAAAGPWD